MATPLTWHNVAYPPLGDPADSLRLAQAAFDKGMGGLATTATAVDKSIKDTAAARVLARQFALQDPNEQARAAQDGSIIGDDSAYLTADLMTKLINNQSDMQKTAGDNIAFNDLMRKSTEADKARELIQGYKDKTNVDLYAQLNHAAITRNQGLLDSTVAQLSRLGVSGDVMRNMLTNTQADTATQQTQAQRSFDLGKSATEWDEDRAATAITTSILRNRSPANKDEAFRFVNEAAAEAAKAGRPIPQTILSRVFSKIDSSGGGAGTLGYTDASTGGAGGGVPTANAGGASAPLGSGAGTKAYPITSGGGYVREGTPLGEWVNDLSVPFWEQQKSAMGTYQLIRDNYATYGKKVYGDSWAQQPLNDETQFKIAEAFWNDQVIKQGKDPAKLFDFLNKQKVSAEDRAIVTKKGVAFSEVAPVIAKYESGVRPSPSQVASAGQAAVFTAAKLTGDTANAGSMRLTPEKFVQLHNSQLGMADVVNQLVTTPQFKDANAADLGESLRKIQQRALAKGVKLSPEAAGMIAANSSEFQSNWSHWLGGDVRGTNTGFKTSDVDQHIRAFSDVGGDNVEAKAQLGLQLKQLAEQQSLSVNSIKEAQQRLAQAKANDYNRGTTTQTAAAQARLDAAVEQSRMLTERINSIRAQLQDKPTEPKKTDLSGVRESANNRPTEILSKVTGTQLEDARQAVNFARQERRPLAEINELKRKYEATKEAYRAQRAAEKIKKSEAQSVAVRDNARDNAQRLLNRSGGGIW